MFIILLVLPNNYEQDYLMKIQTIAKYIDQPAVISKLHSLMPAVLTVTGVGVWGYETFHNRHHSHPGESLNSTLPRHKHHSKTQQAFKNAVTIASAAGSAYIGAKGLKIGSKTLFKGLIDSPKLQEVLQNQTKAIDKFLSARTTDDKTLISTLEKSKNRTFTLKAIETITERLPKDKISKEFLSEILPKPENLNSKEIFQEIKRLSLIGLIPVAGGVAGGIGADILTGTQSRKKTANKVKEGVYQYLANIFLCNVGAGAALFASEQMVKAKLINPLTPLKKLGVIFAGITATGIVGGSIIANYISKKCVDPLFGKKHCKNEGIYSERKPEPLDIALHADDIATAGILSGFRWIEPALPVMYFISGYRAGIGYRNNSKNK